MSEGVLKKPTHEFKCTELHMKCEKYVSMYLLTLEFYRHVLLDAHWNFVREYDYYPTEVTVLFACYGGCRDPPHVTFVRKAKETLSSDIFDALIQCYYEHAPNVWKYNVLPVNDINIDDLITTYEKDPNDSLLLVLFYYLKKNTKPLPNLFLGRLFFNNMIRVLTWKGYIIWKPHQIQFTVFTHLNNKENESLFLIALARNRPENDNFFSQMPKDVLFNKIFPLIKWSVPFRV